MGRFGRAIVISVLGLASCRGVSTDFSYPGDLTHPNYLKRTKAVRQFAVQRDRAQLPDAFALLMDEQDHIRVLAHEAITAMSEGGEDFGYRPYLPEAVRIGIVARWEAWWVSRHTDPEVKRG